MNAPKASERGAALLTVLLLVATMAVIAAMALERLNLQTRLAANSSGIAQARAMATAMEEIAAIQLEAIKGQSRTLVDNGWQNRPLDVPVPGGTMTGTLRDGGNCFNLNSLVDPIPGVGGEGRTWANLEATQRFAALMQLLGIAPGDALAVAESAADWIDSDSEALRNGAEDAYYRGLPGGYLPANTLMADRSELRAVKGVTPRVYSMVRPWVCALPVPGPSPVNVNTLTQEQAPLLAMLLPGKLDLATARAIIVARPSGGWNSADAFWKSGALSGMSAAGTATNLVDINSRWFALNTRVRLGSTDTRAAALLDGSKPPIRAVRRIWGEED